MEPNVTIHCLTSANGRHTGKRSRVNPCFDLQTEEENKEVKEAKACL